MERIIQMGSVQTPISQKRIPVKNIPQMRVVIPGRGITGPVRIGRIIESVRQIINHPDRDRLMTELFEDYK